ncbi:hypothetical protein GCM10009122_29720 [Fulvivirga kasyanovii]|uniref:DUF2807 domain-containing protein n=1 Tax=Fulvivirga kasyanovii TaxID=396812 RepID=A0ABW9RJN2_9BACT|nr:head GIN domain-containing protein [Fulvivirga kasyanovii]MTI24292.1 DUF2807 domain-containing protein [Fulvivirga kasyanovii]
MKYRNYIILLIILMYGCDSENAPDCLQKAGDNTEVVLDVAPFSLLEVTADLNVVIEQGPEQIVMLSAGENLISDIYYEVIDDRLLIRNDNSCSWVRSYDFPVVKITHPNIAEIRLAGSGLISSKGTLSFPDLSLISENESGDFKLNLNTTALEVVSNDITNFYMSGSVENLRVMFASGDGRFEASDLHATNANIFHRGTNDIIVHVSGELSGRIISSGDLIYVKTKPTIIDVSLENLGDLIDETE